MGTEYTDNTLMASLRLSVVLMNNWLILSSDLKTARNRRGVHKRKASIRILLTSELGEESADILASWKLIW